MKQRLRSLQAQLGSGAYLVVERYERDGRRLCLAITERFHKRCRKEGVWIFNELCATLKNAAHGFDEKRARSRGGRDGIFLLDRSFQPRNAMMRKLFDGYLDKPKSGVEQIAKALDVEIDSLRPVRLVSHHMRLLGVLASKNDADWLVLVDCDRTK